MIRFLQLTPGEDAAAVRAAIDRVIVRGWFILGPELESFEREFASASGAGHGIGVGTGTDALAIALGRWHRARRRGHHLPLSAAFSALAPRWRGRGRCSPTRRRAPHDRSASDWAAVTPATAAIMPVHLYGQPADMPAIAAIADRHNLAIVEDCCQAHLATSAGRPVGGFSAAAGFSFYPTKNLGALGDGGAIVTNEAALAERARRLRNGGQGRRYEHSEFGVNSRLDELQAAILRARLPYLPSWTAQRRAVARQYRAALGSTEAIAIPPELDAGHVYHLFPVLSANRTALQRTSRPRRPKRSCTIRCRSRIRGRSRRRTRRIAQSRHASRMKSFAAALSRTDRDRGR